MPPLRTAMPRAANLCSSTAAERCSRSSAPSHTSAPSRRRVSAWSSVSRSRLWHGAGSGASSRIPPAFSGTPEASACSSAQSTSDCSSTRRANCRDAECLRLGWRASGEDFPRTRVREEKARCGGVLERRGASRRNRGAGRPGCSTSVTVGAAAGPFPRTIPRKLACKRLSIDAQHLRRTALVPADSLEDPEDVAPIDLLERRQVAGLAGGEGGTLATPGTDVLRQVLYANLLAHGERHRPLDTVLQLADVARPRVIKQALGRCAGKTAHPLVGVLTIPLDEVLGEQQHVRATRPERWQLDLDDGHAEEEVLPEPALVNRRPQFLVRVGDEAHVEGYFCIAADRADHALLESAKKLGLQANRQVADFIEEQGSSVRLQEETRARSARVGERAPRMPEEFTLEERFGDSSTVDGHEGPGAPRPAAVQGARDQLLASAALACDEHRRLRLCHPCEQGEYVTHRGALTNELLKSRHLLERAAEALDGGREPALFDSPLEHQGEYLEVNRLGDEVVSPCTDGADGRLQALGGGQDDDRQLRPIGRNPRAELQPVHALHHHVGEHHVDFGGIEQAEGLRGRGCWLDLEVPTCELRLQQRAHARVVVDEENSRSDRERLPQRRALSAPVHRRPVHHPPGRDQLRLLLSTRGGGRVSPPIFTSGPDQ